ncbi:MAG: hypothetical protein MUE74_02625 [Bacteroidales bacterium]|jgi:hypothetical protein|nr:hypothetical protein [Bacteroidales bacterium]
MWRQQGKYRRGLRPAYMLAVLFISMSLYSQEQIQRDTTFLNPPFTEIILNHRQSFFSDRTGAVTGIIPARISYDTERNALFYDSLQTKASRYLITRKLYDLIVTEGRPSSAEGVSESSQSEFIPYSGMRISKISIQRLDVFGTNIKNPLSYNPSGIEAFLNHTHLNTNEIILRNNLLFHVGDTVSPLILSDNERLIRELPFIDESRIIVLPVSGEEVEVLVITRDVYSLGAELELRGINKGKIAVFDKNLFGLGHEFRLSVPYDPGLPDSPGFGIEYGINNIFRTFIGIDFSYFDGLGEKTYGFRISRNLVSSTTKYAGGISLRRVFTSEDLDGNIVPEPLKYNLQDYWLSRSFLLSRESVTRLIAAARYTNNNVFDRPVIMPDTYHYLQKYRMFLGALSFTMQKYYKTSLIYGYGRTEDIPYGGMITLTGGREINEFRDRYYSGIFFSTGHSIRTVGYFYTSAGFSTFINNGHTDQGMLLLRTTWFSNLMYLRSFRIRNFLRVDYTRGFDRNKDEFLSFSRENGLAGFTNDSVGGTQRLSISLESVLFSPSDYYGFRFAFFAFGELAFLFGTNEYVTQGQRLSGVGLGVRIRNDNLVFRTFQIRLGYYPCMPLYSKADYVIVSGEQLLRPDNFNPGPPTILPYR